MTGYHVISAVLLYFGITLIAFLVKLLGKANRTLGLILAWSWTPYLSSDPNAAGNQITFAFKYVWTSVLAMILLVIFLPVLAFLEEILFRRGTKSWRSGLIRSLIFGTIHITAGTPVGTSVIVLSILGIVFTREYFEGTRRAKWAIIVDKVSQTCENPSLPAEHQKTVQLIKEQINLSDSRKQALLIRKLGFFQFGFTACSIASWKDIDVSWDNVFHTTFHLCQKVKLAERGAIQDLEAIQMTARAGFIASTLLHLAYNLITLLVFFVSILIRQAR